MESQGVFEVSKAFGFLNQGGLFMWMIFLLSIAASAVAIERFYFLFFKHRFSADHLYRQIRAHLIVGDRGKASELCKSAGEHPVAKMLLAGLRPELTKPAEVNRAMESEALFQAPQITQRLNFLSTFANAATLLGLLGTIAGLIASFNGLAGAAESGLSKEEALAAGISVAMYTTAFGLIVAIPTMLAYVGLSSRAQKILGQLDHYSSALNRDLFNPFTQEEPESSQESEPEAIHGFDSSTDQVSIPDGQFHLNEELEKSLAETRLRQSALDRKRESKPQVQESVLEEITRPHEDVDFDEESLNPNAKTEVSENPFEDSDYQSETTQKDERITGVKRR